MAYGKGEGMTSTEIWLRLIQVGDLSGDKWLSIAQQLERSSAMTAADLQVLGMTVAQTRRFFSLSARELDRCLTWLADPQHHLIVASDAAYPEPLRAIADYPGALFVKGDIAVLKSQQLAVVGSRAHS